MGTMTLLLAMCVNMLQKGPKWPEMVVKMLNYREKSAEDGIIPAVSCRSRESRIATLRVKSWRRRAATWYRLLTRI